MVATCRAQFAHHDAGCAAGQFHRIPIARSSRQLGSQGGNDRIAGTGASGEMRDTSPNQ
jgi:hypothetical protein